MRAILTASSERDIRGILRDTFRMFGARQFATYAELIERGIELIAENPLRPGSLDRSSMGRDVRLFSLDLASGRRGSAAHHLYYLTRISVNDTRETVVLRVLHEKMRPETRVGRALAAIKAPLPDKSEA